MKMYGFQNVRLEKQPFKIHNAKTNYNSIGTTLTTL